MVSLGQSWRQLLSFGAGAGIVVSGDSLEVALIRLRPDGARLVAATEIQNFRQRAAAEWGNEFAAFLNHCGAKHLAALVVLPRDEVILRTISLPGVEDDDAAAAIGFQLDSLHPYPEDEVYYDWQRIGAKGDFAIAIAPKSLVDAYAAMFEEAGVRLSGISLSASAYFRAIRILAQPPQEGFLARSGGYELYGESPSRPLLSALLEDEDDRDTAYALAELRLPPEQETVDIGGLLPGLKLAPEAFDVSRWAGPYAASLAAAAPQLGPALNLLPAARRSGQSRIRYVPTMVLAALLAMTGITVGVQGGWQDREYLGLLRGEIARVDPVARQVEALDRRIEETASRARSLDEFRLRTKADLDVIQEVTRLLDPPAYASGMDINRSTVVIAGEADQAEGLLKLFDSSTLFNGSEFTTPISKTGPTETFRIRMSREARK